MKLTLNVWRQKGPRDAGRFVTYKTDEVNPEMSFLEMLDVVNQGIIEKGDEPIAFDHDCREGICGTCGVMINGVPHGRQIAGTNTTTCQLHMRFFKDGDTVTIEPWRAKSFPVLKDLVVDRSSFDRIIQSGGYVSASTGAAPDGNAMSVPKRDADYAFDAAACIGCGACVAACPNASAMLFTGAKIAHLGVLPQGQPERYDRVINMVAQHDKEGFGGCTNFAECEAACPKGISIDVIARMNRDLLRASFTSSKAKKSHGG